MRDLRQQAEKDLRQELTPAISLLRDLRTKEQRKSEVFGELIKLIDNKPELTPKDAANLESLHGHVEDAESNAQLISEAIVRLQRIGRTAI